MAVNLDFATVVIIFLTRVLARETDQAVDWVLRADGPQTIDALGREPLPELLEVAAALSDEVVASGPAEDVVQHASELSFQGEARRPPCVRAPAEQLILNVRGHGWGLWRRGQHVMDD